MDHSTQYFGLNNLSIEAEIRKVEKKFDISLGPTHSVSQAGEEATDRVYYPQFSERIRGEAERMAGSYILFYSLENAIRDLIVDVMQDSRGADWWDQPNVVPDVVLKNAKSNRKKEEGTGVTLRSDRMIDYTNFGELGEIIKSNWDCFQDIFRDRRAVERILANLNTLRASIAHSTAFSEDEETRLHLSLRDWFRQQA